MSLPPTGSKKNCRDAHRIAGGKSSRGVNPPVTGPITSLVAATRSGWVQPLLTICKETDTVSFLTPKTDNC